MKGGTLVVTRAEKMHEHYKSRFEDLGFKDVVVTGKDKDGLRMLIGEMEPDIMIIGASFYKCCTPYMVGELKKEFPDKYMAAIAIGEYPADLAMYFYINGGCSYVNSRDDGVKEFYHGLDVIRKGREYVSPTVQERIDIRKDDYPKPSVTITDRQIEIIRCVCNGFTDIEAADALAISKRTVNNEKNYIFSSLCVRNEKELIRSALYLGYITVEELKFYGRDYMLKPERCINKEKKKCLSKQRMAG